MYSLPIPALKDKVQSEDFARSILALSDAARHLSDFSNVLTKGRSDNVLTGYVRDLSVALSNILASNGRMFTRIWQDGKFPRWPQLHRVLWSKQIILASPRTELEFVIDASGERRRLQTPEYRHGFAVHALPGLTKVDDDGDRYTILSNHEVWSDSATVSVSKWLQQKIFEVDGQVYNLAQLIKIVRHKESAHIDAVVDSGGIYTGTGQTVSSSTDDEKFIRSRLAKFGPFTYPHVVVFLVARYLVQIVRESLTGNRAQVDAILKTATLNPGLGTSIRQRLELIVKCPMIGRLSGLKLEVRPENLVMRPPIPIGGLSAAEEQAQADALPRYGETYIGSPLSLT